MSVVFNQDFMLNRKKDLKQPVLVIQIYPDETSGEMFPPKCKDLKNLHFKCLITVPPDHLETRLAVKSSRLYPLAKNFISKQIFLFFFCSR